MLEYLEGKVVAKREREVVLSVGPLAFSIRVNDFLLNEVSKDQQIKIYTHLYSREDTLELYGFLTQEERKFFHLLISISGIGPKSAVGILSITTPERLKQAISQEKAGMLTKVSGIGKKTAERIIVELKSKFKNFSPAHDEPEDEDLFDALVGLGYKVGDIREVLKKLPAENIDLNQKIKLALKELSGNRN